MSWTRLALSNPVATLVAVLLVVLFGALSLTRLPVQLTPEVERPEITISTLAWSMGLFASSSTTGASV